MQSKKLTVVQVGDEVYRVKKATNVLDVKPGELVRETKLRGFMARNINVDFVEATEKDEQLPPAPVIRFTYNGRIRYLEAYSFKKHASTGNLLLYGREVGDEQLKSFNLHDIRGLDLMGARFIAVTE